MARIYYEIPLTPAAQSFFVTLAGVQYRMVLSYRTHQVGGWFLDIYLATGAAVLLGLPLVTGVDLFAAYPDLGFGGSLRVMTDGAPLAAPTYANLGLTAHLYFGAPS